MKIIVCGAGQVGFNIAQHLANQQHDVTVIEQEPGLVRQISEKLDVQALVGHASSPEILERAGAADADLLVAVTNSDEVNMIACQVAHSLFSVPMKIARVRNQTYQKPKWIGLFSRDHMPIDVIISPEREVAKALYRRLRVPGTFNMVPFADARVHMLGLTVGADCPVVDTPLHQLTELFPNLKAVVGIVERHGRLFVPTRDDQLEVGDLIYVASDAETSARTMAAFGLEQKEAQRVVIVGGGNVGLFLARYLERTNPHANIKIIEINRDRATLIAEKLDRAVVICGDALDQGILSEASVGLADTLVSVADDDEVNILSSLLSKRQGCRHVMSLINNPVYKSLIGSLGIDVALDPKETSVSSIVRYIRRGRIRDLYSIFDGRAEIIEAEVLAGSEVAGKELGHLRLGGEARFCMIQRAGETIVPCADMVLKDGDRVVVLALADAVRRIEQLFSAKADIF